MGDVERAALAVGLTIDQRYLDGVAANLERLMAQARLVMDVALPLETEPAPIFRP